MSGVPKKTTIKEEVQVSCVNVFSLFLPKFKDPGSSSGVLLWRAMLLLLCLLFI